MKKTMLLSSVIVLVLVASACVPQSSGPSVTPGITPTAVDPAAAGSIIITLADQGSTLKLVVGESFLLKLGEAYTWDITISDPNVLGRVRNIAVVRGAQGVYEALQAGTVTLTAAGDPLCRQSQPACGMPSIQFKITVMVV